MDLVDIQPGVPENLHNHPDDVSAGAVHQDKDLFHEHLGLFVTVIVVGIVCLLVIILAIIIVKCCYKPTPHGGYMTANIKAKVGLSIEGCN